MCLIDLDFSLMTHVEEALLGVYVGLACYPGSSVHSSANVLRFKVQPLNRESDRIFGWDAHFLCDSRCRNAQYTYGFRTALHGPYMEVDVMRVQVVAYVRRLPGPRTECFELKLRLAHVAHEMAKVAQISYPLPGILVDEVVPFVDLYCNEDPGLLRSRHDLAMLFQRLDHRLRAHDVQSALDGLHHDFKVGIVGSEDSDNISFFESVHRCKICLRITAHIIFRKCLALHAHVVKIADRALEVLPHLWKLFPICSSNEHSVSDEPTVPQVEENQPDDALVLVRLGRVPASHEPSGVFSGAH
mmetsp:Transcript_27426/g.44634  ORF Transcript_27426/g.44634 Transcript_27426/m.44634 type:complete len:301 (-) Transcript_27426:136-1038(-)